LKYTGSADVFLHEIGNGNGGDPFATIDRTTNVMLASEPLNLIVVHLAADQSELAQEKRFAQVMKKLDDEEGRGAQGINQSRIT
jgi:hypothetical protein